MDITDTRVGVLYVYVFYIFICRAGTAYKSRSYLWPAAKPLTQHVGVLACVCVFVVRLHCPMVPLLPP